MATNNMAFDPLKYGATPVQSQGGFDPTKYGATTVGQPTKQSSPSDSIWQSIAGVGKAIGAVTGGNVIGDTLGTIGVAGKEALTGHPDVAMNILKTEPSVPQQIGDIAKSVATVGGIAAAPATALGAVGTGVVAGGLNAGGGTLAEGGTLPQAAQSAATGAATGGALAGGVAGAGKLLSLLPNRLVKSALPKLNDSNVGSVLKGTKLGTIEGMLNDSIGKVSSLGGKIQDILGNEQYAADIGNAGHSLENTVAAFPQSEYTSEDVSSAVKAVVPGFAKIATNIENGTATLADKNQLRSAIDMATKKVFTDSPQVSATKTLAAAFANELRQEVQSAAPETQPIFAELSKELNLRNALQSTAKKQSGKSPINLYSILSFLSGGLPAALGEEFARSPATSIATAKAANATAPVAQKIAAPLGTLAGGLAGQGSSQPNQ